MRVIDGGEPSEFKSLFKGWKDQGQSNGLGTQYTGKSISLFVLLADRVEFPFMI